MANVPQQLLDRLSPEAGAALTATVDAIGEELAIVHEQNRRDHREARGDNAQVYGFKVWHHGHFRVQGRFDGDSRAVVLNSNGSYKVTVASLSLGVYKLGNHAEEDIHECFPEGSPTKRGYGEQNRDQLALFKLPPDSPLPPEARYGLSELIVGHFGNPREGLTKWYVGAYVLDDTGLPRWAWVERQDLPAEDVLPVRDTVPVVPYGSGEAEPLEVRPRRAGVEQAE